MKDNVVSLFGGPPSVSTGAPNALVVQELECLLQAAQAGEIVGFAGCYLHRDNVTAFSFAGLVGSYSLIGAISCLKERLVRLVLSHD